MSDSKDKHNPSRRKASSLGADARKSTARKSIRQSAPPSASASKPKTARPSRSSKIPKLTTTSQLASGSGTRARGTGKIRQTASSSQNAAFAPASTPNPRVTGASRSVAAPPAQSAALSSEKSPSSKTGPRARGTSASNDLAAFTRDHPRIMIPVYVLIALIIVYSIIDITASFGRIHPGVSVQGVDVGGLSVEEASVKLNDALSPQLQSARISIYESGSVASADGIDISNSNIEQAYADETAGSDVNNDGSIDKWNITAETIGAYVDGQALADEAYLVGRQGNFIVDRFISWFGACKLPATVSVREERFNALMTEINQEIGLPIVDSLVVIENGSVSVSDGKDGWSVQQDEFIKRFSAAAFDPERPYYVVPMATDPMRINPATAQKVADDVRKAISEDVTIVHDPNTWTLDTADLGNLVSQQVLKQGDALSFGNGTQKVVAASDDVTSYASGTAIDPETGYMLQAYVDQEKMDRYLVGVLGSLATGGATDAYFDTSSGEVVLVEAVEGFGPDRSAAEIALQELLFGSPDPQTAKSRTITLVDVTIQPEITTAKAQAMGITERLATWTIPLSGSSERITNLKLLCAMIDHCLVAPGETWSFNGTTGERTAEKGFQTAPVIINGKHEDQLGGGICQVATCVFNAACFSGLGIAERVNHDFYIASYDDDGFNDATVSWKSPDLKWVNDMSTYVLITAVVTDEDVVVSFWGTKDGRVVECQRGEWREGDKFAQITEVDPEKPVGYSEVTQRGQDGRSIDIRYLCTAADGTVLHDVLFHSVYSAQNEITTIGGAGAPAAAPAG